MRTFFHERGDDATAALSRPSSMEFVRGLGGDPFTFVSEMPLFLREARKELARLEERGDEESEILALSLAGLIAKCDGDEEAGLEKLQLAADREDARRIPSGPPGLVKPALELYGEVLLETGRCDQAREAFERSLARMPGRRLSVRGAEAAGPCS